jgi:hypothetical protein
MTNEQRFLIESVTSEITKYIIEDKSVDLQGALKIFYSNEVSDLLENVENKLYIQSPAYIYEKFFKAKE